MNNCKYLLNTLINRAGSDSTSNVAQNGECEEVLRNDKCKLISNNIALRELSRDTVSNTVIPLF